MNSRLGKLGQWRLGLYDVPYDCEIRNGRRLSTLVALKEERDLDEHRPGSRILTTGRHGLGAGCWRRWKDLLNRMHQPNYEVNFATYTFLLRCCGNARAMVEGKCVHAHIVKSGYERDTFLGNLLIDMYDKCGSLRDACQAFHSIHQPNLFSWNAMIAAYARHGQGMEAHWLFQKMHLEGVLPNKFTFISVFSACTGPVTLTEGKEIHKRIMGTALELDIFVATAIVNMYGKCGSLEDARKVFDKMPERNVISWTAIIAAYARHGQSKEALQLVQMMQLEGVMPNNVTFVSLLESCASKLTLPEGMQLHKLIIDRGFESSIVVGNALISMYCRCGGLENARGMFNKMTERNVVSWTIMIAAYAQHGRSMEALQLFHNMQHHCIIPDKITYVSILSACASEAVLCEGKWLHASIVDSGFETDVIVGNALINMYGKCGSLYDAQKVFEKMPDRNVISWNALIAAYVQNGRNKEALGLFQQMQLESVTPDRFTLASILSAFACEAALAEGKVIHAQIVDCGFGSDVIVRNALVNMYGKCGRLEDALNMFYKVSERDVFTWSAIIAAYVQHGEGEKAIKLFQQMQIEGVMPSKVTFIGILSACTSQASIAEGKWIHAQIINAALESDVVVRNALVNMYSKCGCLEDARRMFDKMSKKDVVSWNIMIAAYAQDWQIREVFRLYTEMQLEGTMPDKVTFISILDACSCHASLAECKWVHACIVTRGLELDVLVGNALVNLYGKCASLQDARRIFDKIPQRNVFSWNTLLTAYAHHAEHKEVLQIFQEMHLEDVNPDKVTFISILSSCSHTGFVDDGNYCFVSMYRDYGVMPTVEHYNCMISLLGRVGQLDEGENLIINMPVQPSSISWMSLFNFCRVHSDLEHGIRAAYHVFELDPNNAAPYASLSKVYAASGMQADAAKMRKLMEDRLQLDLG